MSQMRSFGTGSPGGSVDCARFQCQRPTKGLHSAQAELVAKQGTEAHDHCDTLKSSHCVLLAVRDVRIGRRHRHAMTFRENAGDSAFAVLFGSVRFR
jgi:hypothetical protein